MSVAIQCVLERTLPGVPLLDGKSLAMAYCSDAEVVPPESNEPDADIIRIDFGGSKPPQSPAPPANESLLTPLDAFMPRAGTKQWHNASSGLVAVRGILRELRDGATVSGAEDFGFGDGNDEDLTEGVRYDLETLEQILVAAEQAGSGFCLAFDV